MSGSTIHLKASVAILLSVILLSYMANWNSIDKMYEHIIAVDEVSDQLSIGEKLHSSTISMFLIATNMHSSIDQNDAKRIFYVAKQKADYALKHLRQDSEKIAEKIDDGSLQAKISRIQANYQKLEQAAEHALSQESHSSNYNIMMPKAHALMNSIFDDYSQLLDHYSELQKELCKISGTTWKKATTTLAVQIGIGVILIVLVLLYLDRVVVKTFEITERLALYDKLTGALNRHALTRLVYDKSSGKQHIRDYSVVLLDIDHFKKFNDTYGHDAGDVVLKEVVKTITATVRSQDKIVRYGGEEFIIFLPSTDSEGAYEIGEKIRQAIENEPIILNNVSESLKITISAGVATSEKSSKLEDVVKKADTRLYKAKENGRNSVVMSD